MKLLIQYSERVGTSMNRMLLTFVVVLISLTLLASCSRQSAGEKANDILANVTRLQDEKDVLLKEFLSRENIWVGSLLDRFPANRAEFAPLAQKQIETLTRITEIDIRQIEELRRVQNSTSDAAFRTFVDLRTQIFEKRLELRRAGIRRFEFVSDERIPTRAELEQKLEETKAIEDKLEVEIQTLEQKVAEHRITIGK